MAVSAGIIKAKDPVYKSKTLIVYYLRGRNNKSIAEKMHSLVGGYIKRLENIEAYPETMLQ